MKRIIYQKKSFLKFVTIVILSIITVSACKKELYQKEKINANKAKEINALKKDGKLQTITFEQFKGEVKVNALGSLKDVFYTPKNTTTLKGISSTLPVINDYVINTKEIKLLEINGTTNYVFSL